MHEKCSTRQIGKYNTMSSRKAPQPAAIETHVENEVYMAVCIQLMTFLVVMPHSHTGGYQHSDGTMMLEAAISSRMLVSTS
jgi:hypothetical protein